MKLTTRTRLAARILLILIGSTLLAIPGCEINGIRQVTERETTWAKMGTPCRITDKRLIEISIPDGIDPVTREKKWRLSTAALNGMVAIDEPTLEYYQKQDKEELPALRKELADLKAKLALRTEFGAYLPGNIPAIGPIPSRSTGTHFEVSQ